MNKFFVLLVCFAVFISFLLISLAFLFFRNIRNVFVSLVFVSFLLLAFPIVFWKYTEYRKVKELEENFPIFLRDFVESVRGGLTVPEAFKSVAKNDYKALTPYIKRISARLDWGIPIEKVLLTFVKETRSKLIGRVISSVIETHRFGGKLAETFESLSEAALEIEKLRMERKLYLQSQMITGYLVFFLFIGVIVALQIFLIPSLAKANIRGIVAKGLSPQQLAEEYRFLFKVLIIMQSFFAGLMVGKMSEGSIAAGLKHSLIMLVIGGIAIIFFG